MAFSLLTPSMSEIDILVAQSFKNFVIFLRAPDLSLSPQVLVERSIKGWKEVEYEVVRAGLYR